MIRDEATENQLRAADPGASTWLAANAGSGKTRVLTDRVARLLLRGTDPQNILCLTYTKAAAAEMQNRLFRRLGEWAMLPDAALRTALADLGETVPEGTQGLARARRLFAQAMEVPGGLRIQTIHAFCAGLLRRFPLEAGVNPQFSEMEDRAATLLRAEIADRMAEEARAVTDAFLAFAGGDDLDPLLQEITARAGAFAAPFDAAELRRALDLPPGASMAGLVGNLLGEGERDLIRRVAALCATGSANDLKAVPRLAAVRGVAADLAVLEDVFLTGATAKEPFSAKTESTTQPFPTKKTRAKAPDLMADLDDLMGRVAAARPLRLGLLALARARALHDFARGFLDRYEAAKTARGVLDFDDLITRARHLLEDRAVAQWVLFKLDGGLDHMLVDEAQDTSPAQWAVIRGLAQEFAAGQGAREVERTIFVVGDRKQSIYSFQGADPDQFDRMRDHFGAELAQIGRRLEQGQLAHSFRSAPAILRAVDHVFQGPHLDGLGPEPPLHRAFKDRMPGRVDLWPPVPKMDKDDEPGDWTDPVDRVGARHHARVLAEQVADRVRQMVDSETIPAEIGRSGTFAQRPVTEGDVLILVQRRSDLFQAIIRELKLRGLKVAGADRLRVGAELAVKDIGALLRFLSLASDDLSLAETLRSPLFGWTEQDLFSLAARRAPKATLWEALRHSGRADTLAVLDDLRRQADFLRPYDLMNRLLVRHDGRRRLLARLGAEAEDGIDALLAQALAYEAGTVPGLTGFVGWMQTDDTDLKRQMESRGDAVRVMTVHGSKGLEAPIVILPDTAKRNARSGARILLLGDQPIWPSAAEDATEAQAALRADSKAADERERRRLLYVAMTRAESWLIVAAAGDTGTGGDSWHAMVDDGLRHAGATVADQPGGPGLRLESGDWSAAVTLPQQVISAGTEPVSADFPPVTLPHPVNAPPLSPSDLGGAKVLPGEVDPEAGDAARARGRLLHRLLELLPAVPAPDRGQAGRALVEADPDRGLVADAPLLLADALRMIADPALADLFAPGARTEVTVTASLPDGRRITGTIDRLIVTPERITLVDYKTNRLVPDRPEAIPEGILRQMGAYAHALIALWPGRGIDVAVLWTATGEVMRVPHASVMAALQRATVG